MATWLVDSGVFIVFQRGSDLALLERLAARDTLVVTEDVFDELTGRLRKPKLADSQARVDESRVFLHAHCQCVEVPLDSPRREELRRGRTSTRADYGEDTSMAWAIDEPAVQLVTNDEKAVGRALRELPGRVVMTHELLRRIVELEPAMLERAAALATTAAQALRDQAGWGSQLPLWWDEWVLTCRAG